jgi:transposase
MSGGLVTKIVDRCRHAVTTAGNDGGLPGLARVQIPGRPTSLTTEQRLQVKEAVRQCPRALGYHMSLWRTKLVRHFIYTRIDIEYCRERVRQLLHALVFRLRRLRHRHLRAKPEEQAPLRESCVTCWQHGQQPICGLKTPESIVALL